MLRFGLLSATGELLLEGRLVVLFDCFCGKLLKRLSHDINIAPLEENKLARRLL